MTPVGRQDSCTDESGMIRFDVVNESVYHAVLIVLFAFAPVVFAALFLIPAPYGRYARSDRGLRAKNAWFWMELPAVVVIFLFAVWSRHRSLLLVVFLLMWETHYVYRTFIYSHLMRGGEERRFPLILAAMAAVFNCLNGYANGYHLYHGDHIYRSSWIYDPRFIFGLLLFFQHAIHFFFGIINQSGEQSLVFLYCCLSLEPLPWLLLRSH